jgi:hypothetical protein
MTAMNTNTVVAQTQIHIKGKSLHVPSVQIDGRTVIATRKWLKIATVKDEDLLEGETIVDLSSFVLQLKRSRLEADIFTFAEKLPIKRPRYPYHIEWENFAVIPITTFSEWWEKRVDAGVRRAVRKAAKTGVQVRLAKFDDDFVQGIVNINDEAPVRQGKPFWHYRKGFDAVKRENSTYFDRNSFLGAYYQDELIGFMRLTSTDKVANVVQFLSMMKHYDKRPANALIAKAVEMCEQNGMSHLLYYNYVYNDPKSSLTEFKRRNGFEQIMLPRYYVPLTTKGKLALRCGFHRQLVQRLPTPFVTRLLRIRSLWYGRKLKAAAGAL